MADYFWKQLEVILSKIREKGWVFHFSKQFLGLKLLDSEKLVSWSVVMLENQIIELKFRTFSVQNSYNYFNVST
jgi:hypothetical protein